MTWPSAAAARARAGGDHLAEDRLAHPADLAGAAAVGAGRRRACPARRRVASQSSQATAVRTVTGVLAAEHRLLEVEVDDDLEVGAPRRTASGRRRRRRRAAAAEERVEDVAEAAAAERVAAAARGREPSAPSVS